MNKFNNRYDLDSLTQVNPFYHQRFGITEHEVKLVNEFVEKLESGTKALSGYKLPKTGDSVRFTSSQGDYSEIARIGIDHSGKYEIYPNPYTPSIHLYGKGMQISVTGETHGNYSSLQIKHIGETEAAFRLIEKGELIFYCKVDQWECKAPLQLYAPYSTKDWAKYTVKKYPVLMAGVLFEIKGAIGERKFGSEEEFSGFVKLREGTIIEENKNLVLWCYKDKVMELEKHVFDLINLPEKYKTIPGGKLPIKVEVNNDLHQVTTFFTYG